MKITIVKYEPYPIEAPTGIAVGYKVKTKTDRSFYIDTVVPVEDGEKLDEVVLDEAWDELGGTIEDKVKELESLPPIVGSTWNPSSREIEADEEEIFDETIIVEEEEVDIIEEEKTPDNGEEI